MAPTVYADVLRRNIRSLRGRAGLNQGLVVERMRALGYTSWHRQTMGNVERGERRVTAEEIFGLAVALETTIAALMSPLPDDKVVEFPSAPEPVTVWSVQQLVHGMNVGLVAWRRGGAEPVYQLVEPANMAEAELRRRAIESERQQPVIAAIVTSDRGVLVGRRNDRTPPWTFIAGERRLDERAEETAIREVKEEATLRVVTGEVIGERDHPATGRHMIYLAAHPSEGTEVYVGDEVELAEVRWVSLAEADDLLPGMFGPVREYLAREIGGG
jgi:8-oxo-dGTP diphosphatase